MTDQPLVSRGIRPPRYALSTGDLDLLPYAAARDYARELGTTGFGMVWLSEVLGREAFTTAQLVLSVTSDVVVASGVARALERVPKSAAAAQWALCDGFPGRYLLGLGVSGAVRERGIGPVPFMREYLADLDAHTERLRGVPGRLPRVLGGYSPGLTALARDAADGLVTVLVTPEHTAQSRELLGPEAHLTVVQWVSLERDPDRARALGREGLAYYLTLPHQLAKFRRIGFDDDDLRPPGSDRLVDACLYWGEPDRVAAAVQRHLDAGADQVALSLRGAPSPEKLRDYRQLASMLGDVHS